MASTEDNAIASADHPTLPQPQTAEALCEQGNALMKRNRFEEAIGAYRLALINRPRYFEAQVNIGAALQGVGRLEEARAAYEAALAIRPDFPEALNNLATVLRPQKRTEEAIAACRRALSLRPAYPAAFNNLGMALQDNGQYDPAIAAFREALNLLPGRMEYLNNLAVAVKDAGRPDDAIGILREALALHPDSPQTHWNLGISLLLAGDMEKGWPEYERRWDVPGLQEARRHTSLPTWDGRELHGKRIVIWSEQGLGDTIQFVRYADLAAGRGGRVVLQVQPELKQLLQGLPTVEALVTTDDPTPEADVQCPLLNLPLTLRTTLATIPATIPYLTADPRRVEQWRVRVGTDAHQLKVGLAWAGRPTHANDRNRSMPLAALAPLSQVPGARFFSLQKGKAAEPATAPPAGLPLTDWTHELTDLADTAAFISNLDLIVTVDTSIAHLAGALGTRTWLLLPFAPDWRWMLGRSDSPRYPTMRLFRQPRFGDWASVVEDVLTATQQRPAARLCDSQT
jgi:Flp pilus assembly protein TadD